MTTTVAGGSTRSTDIEDDAFRNMSEDDKELFASSENGDVDDWGNITTEGIDHVDEEIISLSGRCTRGSTKTKLIQSEMLSYKQKGSYDMAEDVYAFITVAPLCSMPFSFACAVIFIKYVVYYQLLDDIIKEMRQRPEDTCTGTDETNETDETVSNQTLAHVVKFFLLPVAVAMQEDLMAVYAGVANARYDSKVLEISKDAKLWKFCLAYLLRLIDGLLSLIVNIFVMMKETDVLNVFLNFAALHFLQDIDDVFYALVEKGFFGDNMEEMVNICKQISWPRRSGSTRFSQFLTSLDTILFFSTLGLCVIFYVYYTVTDFTGENKT